MSRKIIFVIGLFTTFVLWAGLATAQTRQAVLIYDNTQPALKFAAGDLKAALEETGQFVVTAEQPSGLATQTAPVQIIVTTNGAIAGQPPVTGLSKEGYAIRRVVTGGTERWWLIGHDVAGAMYAGLEVADSIEIDASLANVIDNQINPNMAVRGIKFNIPLDSRTQSYADDSASAQANTPEVWSLDYWKGFLDEMARNRLNSLSLWNNNPFPSMVKVDEYPNASLADVKRNTGYLNGGTSEGPEETVMKMTIDQKIEFWRTVMQYAQDRGVGVSIITWNVQLESLKDSGYGFTESLGDSKTKDYYRKAVYSLIKTYPLLAAIGVTAGENMGNASASAKEQWLWDTYGQGYADALREAPGLKTRFIHRAHQSEISNIDAKFSQLPGFSNADSSLSYTFKYSEAHMHSSIKPGFMTNWIRRVPDGKKVALEVRNDDFFNVRWGDPDFARAYLNNIPSRDKVNGFYMGPDGFTWGREAISKNPDTPRQQTIDKLWYTFKIWGSLAYDPNVPNARFQALLGARYPEVPSGNVYNGLASVSKVFPLITRFFWGSLDFKWYPEASYSQEKNGYQGVRAFITPNYLPMGYTGNDGDPQTIMSVKDFVDGIAPAGRLTPPDVANLLKQYANAGLLSVDGLNPGTNKNLKETIGDIKAIASLGQHYAEKILGAVELYRHEKGDTTALANAKTHLTESAAHWKAYAAQWSSQYQRQRLGRVGAVIDLVAMQAEVDKDIPGNINPLSAGPSVKSFTVVNADTGAVIGTFPNSSTFTASGTVSIANAPNIYVRADTANASSVYFEDGTSTFSDDIAPYNYKGDAKWSPAAGTYVIRATPYQNDNRGGTAGNLSTFTLTVEGGPIINNAYDITGLVLVNASNGAVIRTLQTNDTLSLSNLGAPSVSIQAIANSGTKSVKFVSVEAGVSRIEGSVPWALLGNNGNTYTPWTPVVKTYSITASGYSASGASGTAGKPLTININVVQ